MSAAALDYLLGRKRSFGQQSEEIQLSSRNEDPAFHKSASFGQDHFWRINLEQPATGTGNDPVYGQIVVLKDGVYLIIYVQDNKLYEKSYQKSSGWSKPSQLHSAVAAINTLRHNENR
jgi:hypothetical protein